MKAFRFCSWVFYFKDYITRTQNLVQKIKFYRLCWLAPDNSKNHFFTQRLVKNWILWNGTKIKILIWNFYVTKQAKLCKNIKKHISQTKHIADIIKCWYQQKNNDRLPNYLFLFFKKKALQNLLLDGSATFLSLVVQDFWNFVRKDQFHLLSA